MSRLNKILTLAIPTWNRQSLIIKTLESICLQTDVHLIDVIIIDNGSDASYDASLAVLKASNVNFTYIRHESNIGMCANILRCFEESVTNWVWILGDDDPIVPDALSRVIRLISSADELDIICFSEAVRGLQSENHRLVAKDFQGYLATTRSLEAISGISENVFRRSVFMKHISHGYHYSMTLFPHLVVSIAMMTSGSKILFVEETLLKANKVEAAERWYWPSWDLGVGLLLDLPFLDSKQRRQVRGKLPELSTFRFLFIHATAMLSAGFDRSFAVHTYMQGALRCYGLSSTLVSPYTYSMLICLMAPKVIATVLAGVYKFLGKKTEFSYYTKAMKTNRIN
jgi:glycosyltransferase involved in cell wall biosynthesis